MSKRATISAIAALLTTGLSASAFTYPLTETVNVSGDEDTAITVSAATEIYSNYAPGDFAVINPSACDGVDLATALLDCDRGNPAQDAAAECRGYDPGTGGCTVGTDCVSGSCGVATANVCDASAGACHYPPAITSCAVTVGGTSPPACTIVDGDPVVQGSADWHGDLTFTYDAGAGTATVSGVTVDPVTDTATATWTTPAGAVCPALSTANGGPKDQTATHCGAEDTNVPLSITIDATDDSTPDTPEVRDIRIAGIAAPATLSCPGYTCALDTNTATTWVVQDVADGTHTFEYVPATDFATVTDGNNSIVLSVRARTKDGDSGHYTSPASANMRIELAEVADTANVAGPAAGFARAAVEGGSATLGFTASRKDIDGSEALTITASGVPTNGSLSAGTNEGGGIWTLLPTELAGLSFQYNMANQDNDTNFSITFQVQSIENWSATDAPDAPRANSSTSEIFVLPVQMNGTADTPTLSLTQADATINEDTPLNLGGIINASLTDAGGEALFAVITNVPENATLSAGTPSCAGGFCEWTVASTSFASLTFTPEPDSDDDVNLGFVARAIEQTGTCMAAPYQECDALNNTGCGAGYCEPSFADSGAPINFPITVNAVADAPLGFTLNTDAISIDEAASAGGAEEFLFATKGLAADLDDIDGSETLTYTITGVPTGYTFSVSGTPTGTDNGGGSWTFSEAQAENANFGLQLPPNTNRMSSFQLCVSTTATEVGPSASGQGSSSDGPLCFDVTENNTVWVCGDGVLDPSGSNEECDDGNSNSDTAADACRTTCVLPTCGDGAVDTGEECDDAAANNDLTPDACRTDCRAAHCGDDVLDTGEPCDDGENGIETDSCLTGCIAASCGDNIIYAGVEECDWGANNSDVTPGACRTSCLNPYCGDGVPDAGETCDDGNAANDDGCLNSCDLATCGDGFVFVGMEECDEGANNSDLLPDTCRSTCVLPYCGDAVPDSSEECDDGNAVNEDPCLDTCVLNICGDGFVDLVNEECDDGQMNSDSVADACRLVCEDAYCGDGVKDSGESCDLGAANDDNDPNGCRTNCALPGCGDGIVGPGEECDDGANNSNTMPDACREQCTLPYCGDAVLDTGEDCDDGNNNSDNIPDACRNSCVAAMCGDGVVDSAETCDDGAANSDTDPGACRTSCSPASCGDDVVDPGEDCDNGAANSDTDPDACRTACVDASCGDGVIDAGEDCDDGAANGSTPDSCDTDCTLPAACGDGVVDDGEECDDGALNSDEDADACRTDCSRATCGDMVIDSGEECDDGVDGSDLCDTMCVAITGGEDMGGTPDMGGNNANNMNNTNPDMGSSNNAANNEPGADMGMGDDTGGGGVGAETDEGCCRTVKRSKGQSDLPAWLAAVALGLVTLRRRR